VDTRTYLSASAVHALARVRTPEVVRYLTDQLVPAADIRVICAAVRGLAGAEGEKAIPALAAALEANRQRPDGFEDLLWKECADSLGRLGTSKALPVLQRELEWVGAGAEKFEYGTQLVAAVARIGDAAGAPILDRYADDLTAKIPVEPRPKAYVEERIKETRAAAEVLRKPAPASP